MYCRGLVPRHHLRTRPIFLKKAGKTDGRINGSVTYAGTLLPYRIDREI